MFPHFILFTDGIDEKGKCRQAGRLQRAVCRRTPTSTTGGSRTHTPSSSPRWSEINNEEAKNKVSPDAKRIVDVLSPEKALLLYTYRDLLKERTDLELGTVAYRFSNDDPSPEVINMLETLEQLRKNNSKQFVKLAESIFDYLAAKQNKARGGDLTYSEIREVFLKGNKLLEVVTSGDDLAFAVYDSATRTLVVTDVVEIDGRIVKAPPMGLKFLPAVPQAVGDDLTLWRDTRRFIRLHIDLPNEDLYDVLTAFVALSWLYDAPGVETVPILFLHGPFRTGKSRTFETLESVCRNASKQSNVTGPSLFHFIEAYRPTLLLDYRSFKNMPPEVLELLAHCYRRGARVWRVIDPSLPGEKGLRGYDIYCLVAIVAHDEPPVDILSRDIKINMQKNQKPVRKKIDLEEATKLRTRWLAQRFRHYFDFVVFNTEYKSEDSRLSEIISPLVVCAHLFGGPEAEEAVRRYAATLEEEHQVEEVTSPEAQVLTALIAYLDQHDSDAPEHVSASDLLPYLGDKEDDSEDSEEGFSPSRIGRALARLGFKKIRIGGRKRGFLVDLDLIDRLSKRFIKPEEAVVASRTGYVDD